ncbi:hypothetical protein FRB95_012559 [Tulasnella sp. JGI-2019a]|nr:hypothetical protein FRB95_012559 [Tulasnella sp. JGI-2019a]
MALYANGRNRLLAKAPIPGPWFRGCFPLLTRQDSSGAVWATGLAVQCIGTITVVYITIRTWRASDSYRFLAIAQQNGIFYFMAITFSTIFAQTFFYIAPLSLILASLPISIGIYSIFGPLLLINLLEQQNSPLDLQGELSTFLYRAEISRAGLNSKGGKDLELGVPHASGLLKKDSPRTGRIETLQQQQQQIDEWATLDEALAEEYDKDGKRRKPRRMHERKWKSDELVIVTPPTFPSAVAPGPRLADPNFGSPGGTPILPRSPWAFSSHMVTSLSSLTKPPPQTKKVPARPRFSILLHRRHPSKESNPASTSVPAPVLDAVDVSTGINPVSPPIPDSPPQSLHRLSSTRRSSQSDAARTRRLPGGLRSLSSIGSRPRGEGDGATISSASTGWAFENNHTRDAPDFGN